MLAEFVGIMPVSEADGQVLFSVIKGAIEDIGLALSDCVGYGSDGVMVGSHNSVAWTRIKDASPNGIQMVCICHSLAL